MCAGLDLGVRTVAESMRNLGLAGLNTHQRQSKRGGLSTAQALPQAERAFRPREAGAGPTPLKVPAEVRVHLRPI